MNLQNLLCLCITRRASDLHLSSGVAPVFRVDGDLIALNDVALSHDDIHASLMTIMSSAQQSHFSQSLECDFSLTLPDVSRFRVNVFQQARGVSAVFRVIPHGMPSLQTLQAPPIFSQLIQSPRGLVLVTGPTGSGKSTIGLSSMCYARAGVHIAGGADLEVQAGSLELIHQGRALCGVQQVSKAHAVADAAGAQARGLQHLVAGVGHRLHLRGQVGDERHRRALARQLQRKGECQGRDHARFYSERRSNSTRARALSSANASE